jgi:hypothetical protein
LKFLGVVGGGTTAFFVLGAIAIWMQLWLLYLPPDRALGAMSKQDIVAISARGMFVGDVLALAVGWWIFIRRSSTHRLVPGWQAVQRICRSCVRRREGQPRYVVGLFPAWAIVALVAGALANSVVKAGDAKVWIGVVCAGTATLVGLAGLRLHGDNDERRRAWDTAARWLYLLALVYAATWASWSMLGLAVGVLIADRVGGSAVRHSLRNGVRDRTRALTGLLLAVLLGGMLSQVGEKLPLAVATLAPPPADPLLSAADTSRSYPYLGESNGYIYVVRLGPKGGYDGTILTVKRDSVTVTFSDERFPSGLNGNLQPVQKSPAAWLSDRLSQYATPVWDRFLRQSAG